MSKWNLRNRIARRLIASPLVGIPVGLGVATWLVGTLLGDDALVLLGAAGLLFGFTAAVSRLQRHGPQIRRAAAAKFRDGSHRNHEQFLNDLERRLQADHDERTNQHLVMLRQLHRRMHDVGIFEGDLPPIILPDVKERMKQLYRSCLSSLERSVVLREAALEMMTEAARGKLFRSRESLIGEVGTTIRHLGATLDFLQTSKLKDDNDQYLAQMRQELEFGLEVARRVEDRMSSLERSASDERGLD